MGVWLNGFGLMLYLTNISTVFSVTTGARLVPYDTATEHG